MPVKEYRPQGKNLPYTQDIGECLVPHSLSDSKSIQGETWEFDINFHGIMYDRLQFMNISATIKSFEILKIGQFTKLEKIECDKMKRIQMYIYVVACWVPLYLTLYKVFSVCSTNSTVHINFICMLSVTCNYIIS